MKKVFSTLFAILCIQTVLFAQKHFFEIGIGAKYDHFKIKQTSNVFSNNIDFGALAYISYGRMIPNQPLSWEIGFATNNYKVNFKTKGPNGIIYAPRTAFSVMRSNRIYLNLNHHTKRLNQKLFWVNSFGVSLIIGAKNPHDARLLYHNEVTTPQGIESINLNVKTYGKTGSSILIGADTRLYYKLNKDFKMGLHAGFTTGVTELSKVEIDYIVGSSSNIEKAVFSTNGFSPYLTLGVYYMWEKQP